MLSEKQPKNGNTRQRLRKRAESPINLFIYFKLFYLLLIITPLEGSGMNKPVFKPKTRFSVISENDRDLHR